MEKKKKASGKGDKRTEQKEEVKNEKGERYKEQLVKTNK